MPSSDEPDLIISADEEDRVVDYLRQHPDLLRRRADLLPELEIPHASGAASSLIERQVRLLREQNLTLQRHLEELLMLARANECIDDRLHRLSLRMLDQAEPTAALRALCEGLRELFAAERLVLLLRRQPPVRIDGVEAVGPERLMMSDQTPVQPRCGIFTLERLVATFGTQADAIASAALIPLGARGELGLIGIGSDQPERFTPHMGTLFLRRLAELTTIVLARC